MTDKNFAYYATRAEEFITKAERNAGRFSDEQVANEVAKAQVFATLAAAVVYRRPPGPCYGRLVPAARGHGERPCVLLEGHYQDPDSLHQTEAGVMFRDL
jgi:hypothetical protein